jgi:hypothetical protein
MTQAPRPTEKNPKSLDHAVGREGCGEARREFLARCGRFAVVTPPAMTMLLAVSSIPPEAHAVSGTNSQGGGDERTNRQLIL